GAHHRSIAPDPANLNPVAVPIARGPKLSAASAVPSVQLAHESALRYLQAVDHVYAAVVGDGIEAVKAGRKAVIQSRGVGVGDRVVHHIGIAVPGLRVARIDRAEPRRIRGKPAALTCAQLPVRCIKAAIRRSQDVLRISGEHSLILRGRAEVIVHFPEGSERSICEDRAAYD